MSNFRPILQIEDTEGSSPERLMFEEEVRRLTGLGRTTRFRLRRVGLFPAPVQISPGLSAWRASDIATWIRDLPVKAF